MGFRDQLAQAIRTADGNNSLGAAALSDAIAAALPGMVKPLEWEEPSAKNNHIHQAHALWGTYGIHICGGRHQAWLDAHEKPYERWLGDGYVGTVYEAKADAEDHYRNAVMALFGL